MQFLAGLSRFQIVLTLIAFVLLVSGAAMRVTQYIDPSINQTEVSKRLADLQKVEFDEEAISRIESLRDSNIDIESKFDPNRQNPFVE